MATELAVDWLGRVPYREALELQEKAVEARRRGAAGDRLLLLEHPPVITLGRSARPENVLASPAELAARGVEVVSVARGGDVTWHGPGQLVGYLVLDLAARGEADVHRHLRSLEGGLVEVLSGFGVAAATLPGMTGVYVEGSRPPRKLASIGVGLRGWVTWHGFALNVTNAPEDFADVVPCGLHQVEMTSLARELGAGAPAELFEAARERVAAVFRRRLA